jgi:hypothetical protein
LSLVFFVFSRSSLGLAQRLSGAPLGSIMRLSSFTIAVAVLLATGAASAAAGDKSAGNSKPGEGPAAPAGESPGGGKTDSGSDLVGDSRRDKATDTTTFADKSWEIGASAEYHHTGLDGGSIDNGQLRNLMVYGLTARWDASPYDRLSVGWGIYETFLIDNGDSAARADDITFRYTRRIPLPAQTTLRLSASFTAPVSYGSQLAGLYTAPKLSIQADKRFGKFFSLDARVTGGVFIVKSASGGSAYNGSGGSGFTTAGFGNNGGGANPDPKGTMSLGLTADLAMPFHDPLSIGLSLYDAYTWFYDVSNGGGCPAGTPSTVCMYGTVMQSTSQPVQQTWAGEVYIRYALPNLGGFKSDIAFAFAPNGDPATGFASVTHGTGIPQVYPFYSRQNAEVYVSVSGRY